MLILLCGCLTTHIPTDEIKEKKGELVVLYDSTVIYSSRVIIDDFLRIGTLDSFLVDSVKSLVKNVIKSHNSNMVYLRLMEVDSYDIQVVPYISITNEQKFWVNCFCIEENYWREKIVQVNDGGNCFFNFIGDVDNMIYSHLYINGR